MNARELGRTGLFASEIGFGCGPGARLMVAGTSAEQGAAVRHAVEQGITYFDTAPIYGDGRSETNLGRALANLREPVVVATKIALELDDLGDIPVAVTRSVEESVRRLQRDSLDLVYLHNRVAAKRAATADIGVGAMLTVDDVLGECGVTAALEALRTRGLIRYFGCCAFGGEAAAIRALIASDAFASILVNYSVLNPSAFVAPDGPSAHRDYEGVAADAARRGMTAAALRILEAGLLTGGTVVPETLGALGGSLHRLAAASADGGLATTAIRFVLSNPAVATAVIGFSSAQHIDQAVEAAGRGPLSPQTLSCLAAALHPSD